MAKKNTNADSIKGWSDVINKSFEESRRKNELLEPNKNMMRYYLDYAKAILSNAERVNMVWDLFEAKVFEKEHAQRVIDNHQEETARLINDLIGYLHFDRRKFHTHNYDKVENHQGILTLHQLKRGLDNEEGYLYFSAAINQNDIYQDETHIAILIEERLPGAIDHSSIRWDIDYILEDYLILKVWLDDFTIEEELQKRIDKY